ncbi:MAG: hypothetical protein GWN58_37345, partial [Anaerolineae bacterium]|nr:hypothetical protein [Anaerolineae bacterium]
LEAAAKKHGISLPKGWTGQVYNENPIEVMLQYVDNMTDTIQAWQTMDAMKGAGLTRQHMSRIDTQST